jgi:hypothetical protein
MRVTKFMRKNIVFVSFVLIFVILFHASGVVEKGLGMRKKSERAQKTASIFSVLKIPNFPPKPEERDDREDKALDKIEE